jgi:hypothetical protein
MDPIVANTREGGQFYALRVSNVLVPNQIYLPGSEIAVRTLLAREISILRQTNSMRIVSCRIR